MPGTTRYSATFDRPYEEDNKVSNGTPRRGRSHSWQAHLEGPLVPLLGSLRTSSSEETSDGVNPIPTRNVRKPVVKTHNNPFQFVKVGSSPLYKKAEEQMKKAKEVKKPEVLQEEEEWQSNLDSWKSRRRKMSADVLRRQEEIRQFEQEEQNIHQGQKKIKTFSEMVESRANRGRSLSLCLISSPLDLQKWEEQNSNRDCSSQLFSEGSEENSAVNSEDEGVTTKKMNHSTHNGTRKKGSSKVELYPDSGLESISSGHRTGDTPDSCSDFSQDSSVDCDSPRVSGLLLEELDKLGVPNEKTESHEEKTKADVLEPCTESSPLHTSEINETKLQSKSEVFIDGLEEQKKIKAKIISIETTSQSGDSKPLKATTLSSDEIRDLNIVFQSTPPQKDIPTDVPPVEKVAEEMEKLILQQLEEEERAKELASQVPAGTSFGSPENLFIAPPKVLVPPKEKPPPPPSIQEDTPKGKSVKRVNSTKRIKKEINMRRSNFLGIENTDENGTSEESCVPPPPALEEILKAEMEMDRENRRRLEDEASKRLQLAAKERQILETLETEENYFLTPEERQLQELNLLMVEEQRVHQKQQLEEERQLAELERLAEEKHLKEREEYIRKQEAEVSTAEVSSAASISNSSVSLGDGNTKTKPAVPPKPLKKKEAIRRERERLRQEQELLQREREQHRRLLAHVPKVAPLPPLKPPYVRTTPLTATEAATSHSSAQTSLTEGSVSVSSVAVNKPHKPVPASRKADPRISKISSPKKEYNQNHWLIQEAEMRRIAELQERRPLDRAPMLSVSGRKRCSHCSEELGRGAAMIIESLQLYYHIECFQCCVCQAQLGNGSRGTDVRVRNQKLHCHNCYSNDEAGLKFSQV